MSDQRIFITGKIERANASQLKEFELAKRALFAKEFTEVRTAADDMIDFPEEMDFDSRRRYFNKRSMNLNWAKVVLYLDNCIEDPKARQEVDHARSRGKLTTSVSLFLKNHSIYCPA